MRTIIAGSRGIRDYDVVCDAVALSRFAVTSVVCGMADGVDLLGLRWARAQPVPFSPYRARDYINPFLRNQAMAENADALVAVWDGRSSGTRDMIHRATHLGLTVYVCHAKLINLRDTRWQCMSTH